MSSPKKNNNGNSSALSKIRSAIEICAGDGGKLCPLQHLNCANLLNEKVFNPNHSVITVLGTDSEAIRTRLITGIRNILLDEKDGVSPAELASKPQSDVQKTASDTLAEDKITSPRFLIHSAVNLLSSENLLSEKIIARFVNDAKKDKSSPSWATKLCEDLNTNQLNATILINNSNYIAHKSQGNSALHPLIKAFQKKSLIKHCSQNLYDAIKEDSELNPSNIFKQKIAPIINAICSLFGLSPFLAPLPNIDEKIKSMEPKTEGSPSPINSTTQEAHENSKTSPEKADDTNATDTEQSSKLNTIPQEQINKQETNIDQNTSLEAPHLMTSTPDKNTPFKKPTFEVTETINPTSLDLSAKPKNITPSIETSDITLGDISTYEESNTEPPQMPPLTSTAITQDPSTTSGSNNLTLGDISTYEESNSESPQIAPLTSTAESQKPSTTSDSNDLTFGDISTYEESNNESPQRASLISRSLIRSNIRLFAEDDSIHRDRKNESSNNKSIISDDSDLSLGEISVISN